MKNNNLHDLREFYSEHVEVGKTDELLYKEYQSYFFDYK